MLRTLRACPAWTKLAPHASRCCVGNLRVSHRGAEAPSEFGLRDTIDDLSFYPQAQFANRSFIAVTMYSFEILLLLCEILFLLGNVHRGSRVLPVEVHGAAITFLIEGDGEIFNRSGGFGCCHVGTRQIVVFARIICTPLTCFLADNERPLVFVGYGEDGVAAGGNVFAADGEVGISNERSGLICPGAPYLAVGHESAIDFARLMGLGIADAGARIVHVNGLAVSELALRVGRWAGTLALVLLRGGCDCEGNDQQGKEGDTFLHGFSCVSQSAFSTQHSAFSRLRLRAILWA